MEQHRFSYPNVIPLPQRGFAADERAVQTSVEVHGGPWEETSAWWGFLPKRSRGGGRRMRPRAHAVASTGPSPADVRHATPASARNRGEPR